MFEIKVFSINIQYMHLKCTIQFLVYLCISEITIVVNCWFLSFYFSLIFSPFHSPFLPSFFSCSSLLSSFLFSFFLSHFLPLSLFCSLRQILPLQPNLTQTHYVIKVDLQLMSVLLPQLPCAGEHFITSKRNRC